MNSLIKDTLVHWRSHNAPRMGAALSYYTMLSFIPLLVLLVTFASSFFSTEIVQGTLVNELAKITGSSAAHYIADILNTNSLHTSTLAMTIVGVGITFFGAVGVFTELDQDFDALWGTPKEQKQHTGIFHTIGAYIHKKIVAFSFVPLLVLVLLLIIGLTVFFSALQHIIILPHAFTFVVSITQFIGPLILGTILFAVIYRILPDRTLPWKTLFVGAAVTTVLFVFGNYLVLEYIKLLVHTDVFGGAASLVGLLVWVYYSAQVFFIGASFTYVYAIHRGVIPSRDSLQSI